MNSIVDQSPIDELRKSAVWPMDQPDRLPVQEVESRPKAGGEFDPPHLGAVYHDDRLGIDMPVFAAASVDSIGGCAIDATLGERNCAHSGALAWELPKINPWQNEEATNKAKTQRALRGATIAAQLAGLVLMLWWVFSIVTSVGITADYHPLAMALLIAAAGCVPVGLIGFFSLLVLFYLGLKYVPRIWLKNTPKNAWIYRDTEWTKTYSAQLPGDIPSETVALIRRAQEKYEDVHLVWEARNQWGCEGVSPEPAPQCKMLIVGEDEGGRFHFLEESQTAPKDSSGEIAGNPA